MTSADIARLTQGAGYMKMLESLSDARKATDSLVSPGLLASFKRATGFVDAPAYQSLVAQLGVSSRAVEISGLKYLAEKAAAVAQMHDGIAVKDLMQSALGMNLKAFDRLVPPHFAGLELTAAARITEMLAADSGLSGLRASMAGTHAALALASTRGPRLDPTTLAMVESLGRRSGVATQFAAAAAAIGAGTRRDLGWPSQPPTVRLGSFLRDLDKPPSRRDLALGLSASTGIASLLAVDVVSHRNLPDDTSESVELLATEVAPTWLSGPVKARSDLMEALSQVAPSLPDLLQGAWDEVASPGAAANVKVSTCAVEVLERTLRAIAPDGEVLAWHARERRPGSDLDSRGGPTYGCRVRYVLRGGEHKGHRKLIVSQVESFVVQVNQLRSEFQAGKHASDGTVTILTGWLMAVETVLHQLVVALPDLPGAGSGRG